MKTITIDGEDYIKKSEVSAKKIIKKGLTYAIVRTYSAGVFAGYIDMKKKGEERTVFNARRLWYWSGAASLSQLAVDGVANPDECKFPCEVKEVVLMRVIEIMPITEKAKVSINAVSIWKQ